MTYKRMKEIIASLTFQKDVYCRVEKKGEIYKIAVSGRFVDTFSGDRAYIGCAENWTEEDLMEANDDYLIESVWLMYRNLVEHEAMENFRYKGIRVKEPHKKIEKLVKLKEKIDWIKTRRGASLEIFLGNRTFCTIDISPKQKKHPLDNPEKGFFIDILVRDTNDLWVCHKEKLGPIESIRKSKKIAKEKVLEIKKKVLAGEINTPEEDEKIAS